MKYAPIVILNLFRSGAYFAALRIITWLD